MPMTQSGQGVSVAQVVPAPPALLLTGDNRRPVTGPWWLAGGGISAANCVAAYQPKGAASYAASKINLAHPGTYNATEGVAPTWDQVNGWTGNGTTMYLSTGIIGATQAYSVIAQFKNANAGGIPVGASDTGSNLFIGLVPNNGGGVATYNYGVGGGTFAPVIASGNMCIASQNFYRNGVLDGTLSAAGFTIDEALTLLGQNDGINGVDSFFSGSLLAVAIYSFTLSAALVAILQQVMAAL